MAYLGASTMIKGVSANLAAPTCAFALGGDKIQIAPVILQLK